MKPRRPLDSYPESMTAAEVAEFFGIGERAVSEAVNTGRLPALRFGKRIVVPREALRKHCADAEATPVRRKAPLLKMSERRGM
jgi:excisionase family DNA binding protein